MSKINKKEVITKEAPTTEFTTDLVSHEDSSIGATHVRRVVVSWNGTTEQLKTGARVDINNAVNLFKPQYDIEKLDEQSKAAMAKLDFSKGIVTGITLKSIYSNVDDSVTLGLNLYQNNPQIVNKEGHLYSPQRTDMGVSHTAEADGFINLANVLPYEKGRPETKLYNPENLLSNRYIEQYGAYTLDKLWENIVPFPNNDYFYVGKDHIILKVINRNWEMLGMNMEAEKTREGEFLRVSKDVVSNVINQLYDQVICQIPYTQFDQLQARLYSNAPSESDEAKIVAELLVEYKYPMVQDN